MMEPILRSLHKKTQAAVNSMQEKSTSFFAKGVSKIKGTVHSLYNTPLHHGFGYSAGPEIIKLFSCSTQLSTKFQLIVKTKIPTNEEVSCFKSLRYCDYPANKC